MKPLREYSTANKIVSFLLFLWMLLPIFLFGYIVAKGGFPPGSQNLDSIAYQEARFTGFDSASGDDYETGYNSGYSVGYNDGKAGSFESGFDDGYSIGYDDGYQAALSDSSVSRSQGSADTFRSIEPSSSSAARSVSTSVYVTESGKKYHSYGCSYLSNSCIEIDLEKAKSQGYTPCSRCNPPT